MAQDVYSYSKKSGDRKGRADKAFDWKEAKPKFRKFDKEDDFEISIIPHIITTKNHPMVRAGFAVGDEAYMMDFWVHSDVGPAKARVVCPNQTWGKPCPICEEQERMSRNKGWDSKEAKALKAKHRVIYNIVMNSERDGDIEMFETSFALFEDELRSIAESKGRRKGGKIIPYGTLSEAVSILFSTKKDKLGKNEFFRFEAFDFDIMNKPLPKSMIEEALDPSTGLIRLKYEEIQEMLDGEEEDDEDDEEEGDDPKPRGRGRSRDDEDDEPKKPRRGRDEDEEPEEPRARRSSRDEDDEEAPKKTSRRSRDEDDPEEPEEPKAWRGRSDEEEETPKRRRSSEDDDEPKTRRTRDEEPEEPKARRGKSDEDDDKTDDRPRRGGREPASEDSRRSRRDD